MCCRIPVSQKVQPAPFFPAGWVFFFDPPNKKGIPSLDGLILISPKDRRYKSVETAMNHRQKELSELDPDPRNFYAYVGLSLCPDANITRPYAEVDKTQYYNADGSLKKVVLRQYKRSYAHLREPGGNRKCCSPNGPVPTEMTDGRRKRSESGIPRGGLVKRPRTASSVSPIHDQGGAAQAGQAHGSCTHASTELVPETTGLNLAEPPYTPAELYQHRCGTCSMCQLPECLRCLTCKMNSSRTRRYREVCLLKVRNSRCLVIGVVSRSLSKASPICNRVFASCDHTGLYFDSPAQKATAHQRISRRLVLLLYTISPE
jgi:hypothetical protein